MIVLAACSGGYVGVSALMRRPLKLADSRKIGVSIDDGRTTQTWMSGAVAQLLAQREREAAHRPLARRRTR